MAERNLDEIYTQCREAVRVLAVGSKDPYTRIFYDCLDIRFDSDHEWEAINRDMLSYLPPGVSGTTAAYYPQKILLSMAKEDAEKEGQKFDPVDWRKPEVLDSIFDRVVTVRDTRYRYISKAILPIAANVPERSKAPDILAKLSGYERPLKILDFGCSLNLIGKMLVELQAGTPGVEYGSTAVMRREITQIGSSEAATYARDEERSAKINALLKRMPLLIEHYIGVDIWDFTKDVAFKNWAIVNSFRIGELMNRRRVNLFDKLLAVEPSNVRLFEGDLTNFDHEGFLESHPEAVKNDIVMASHLFHMLPINQRKSAIGTMLRYVKNDGKIVLIDQFASIPKELDGPEEVQMYDIWPKFGLGAWVLDMKQPEKGFQKSLSIDDGRMEAFVIEDESMARELDRVHVA